jgi:hypothetical protein
MKMRKKLICMLLTIIMVFASITPAIAANNTSDFAQSSDSTPYQFPITPESPEWKSYSTKQEMLDVCQIPEQKLKCMTTEALLETVMAYPLIRTYYAFNNVEIACNVMSNDFNGFNALFARQDVTETLLKKYANTRILTAKEAQTAEPKAFFEVSTVEYLIACNEIKNGPMSADNAKLFSSLLAQKNTERDKTGVYTDNLKIYSTYERTVAIMAAGDTWTAVVGVVKTPKGSTVPEVYQRSPELTSVEKNQINTDFALLFPNATRVADPTVNYNCHSYAWYQQSSSNPYWIGRYNAPSIYTTDGSYYRYYGTPRSGMKAWYNNGEHSGVSIGARLDEYGVQIHYVRSKWGMCGLYEHPYSYSPYTPSVAWYTS